MVDLTVTWERSCQVNGQGSGQRTLVPIIMTLTDLSICSPGYLQAQNNSFFWKKKWLYITTLTVLTKWYGIYSTCWSAFLTQIFGPLIDIFMHLLLNLWGPISMLFGGSHWDAELNLFLKGCVTPGWQRSEYELLAPRSHFLLSFPGCMKSQQFWEASSPWVIIITKLSLQNVQTSGISNELWMSLNYYVGIQKSKSHFNIILLLFLSLKIEKGISTNSIEWDRLKHVVYAEGVGLEEGFSP